MSRKLIVSLFWNNRKYVKKLVIVVYNGVLWETAGNISFPMTYFTSLKLEDCHRFEPLHPPKNAGFQSNDTCNARFYSVHKIK
jgi:hypothetical protein